MHMPIHTGPHNISTFKKGIWWKIVVSCLILVAIGGLNTMWTHLDYKDWYNALSKPSFYPRPSWVVGVIWVIMYIIIGGAVGIIWQIISTNRYGIVTRYANQSMRIFFLQVLVNASVPAFLFGLHNLGLVLAGVIINLILAIFIFKRFFRLDRLAGYLFIPYILWLVYATVLDVAFVVLN